MRIYGVIGAGYGDEGKGMVSAHIRHHAGPSDTVTVLTNGGAQRGHTVCSPDGSRFVFHHIGAAMPGDDNITFCPAPFVVNPMVLMQDIRGSVRCMDTTPEVYIDPLCLVTTPYDMMANQVAELHAGDSRWGSTGMGVWHTKHRSRYVRLTAGNLADWVRRDDFEAMRGRLAAVRSYWLDSYLHEIGMPDEYKELFENEGLVDHWLQDVADVFRLHAKCCGFHDSRLAGLGTVVFENAQGLLLSQERDCMHTTPSFTGAAAIAGIVESLKLGPVDGVRLRYVSRTYLTRHGAGPLPGACPKEFLNAGMSDMTNVWNQWQGELRYGLLDGQSLVRRVEADVHGAGMKLVNAGLVLTHVNEVPNRMQSYGALRHVEVGDACMLDDFGLL